ncbi:HalOD1 output domain-containing protein [Haladaptatus sp. CMAA 1911]|uniref:HalOD1 output domain-containing protein n=1 Tax=unclassified Haladaptatus TaxID=2622732 RepID=UPI0037540186
MTERKSPSDDEDKQRDTVVCQTEFDPTTDCASETVIRAVAILNDTDPTDLTPLSEVVDPDALDALFAPKASEIPRNTNGYIKFNYDAYYIRVDGSGQITVQQSDPGIGD